MKKKLEYDVVMNAAIQCFAKYGYKKTTLDDIAKLLDINSSGLYVYAASKRALYEEAVGYLLRKWQRYVRKKIQKAATSRGKLRALFIESQLYLSRHRDFSAIIHNDSAIFPVFPVADPYEEINNESLEMTQEVLRGGVENGDFREMDVVVVSEILFSLYRRSIVSAYVMGESYNEKYLEPSFKLLSEGIIK
jgi:AcrR family transcriptional regulator